MSDVKVQDVMTHLVVMLYPNDSIHEAARKLSRNHISGAPVVEGGKVIGIVSESDLIEAAMPPTPVDRGTSFLDLLSVIGRGKPRVHRHGETVTDAMSSGVVKVSPSTSVWRAASIMQEHNVKRLPVVDEDDYLLGIVSRADLVKAMAKDDSQIAEDVLEAIRVLGEETVEGLQVDVTDGVVTIHGSADRKTTRDLAIKLAGRTPGVVEVIDRMAFAFNDSKVRGNPESDPDPRWNWQSTPAVGHAVMKVHH